MRNIEMHLLRARWSIEAWFFMVRLPDHQILRDEAGLTRQNSAQRGTYRDKAFAVFFELEARAANTFGRAEQTLGLQLGVLYVEERNLDAGINNSAPQWQ